MSAADQIRAARPDEHGLCFIGYRGGAFPITRMARKRLAILLIHDDARAKGNCALMVGASRALAIVDARMAQFERKAA